MADPVGELVKLFGRIPQEAQALRNIARAGVLGPEPPHRLFQMGQAFERFGPYGAAITIAALRDRDQVGLIDERGPLTFGDMEARANAVAHALIDHGVTPGDGIGIMCRNHRGIVDAMFGVARAGANAIFLNSDFAGPQASDVCTREGVQLIIHDEEFTEALHAVHAPKGRITAWSDQAGGGLDTMAEQGDHSTPPTPAHHGTAVILTSGTTGTPKGATRQVAPSLLAPGALLGKVPFRRGDVTLVAPPLFHALGLSTAALSVAMNSTMVLRRQFDPAATLAALAEHRCRVFIVVPAMLNRLLALHPNDTTAYELGHLRIILSSGSQLGADLVGRTQAAFGDVLYNMYGSTEVAAVAIAQPGDLQAAPGTVGRPPLGVTVRLLGEDGTPAPSGGVGRIFVHTGQEFTGYTGGGGKEVIDGYMATGDVGHLDDDGRLFVDGRDDDMIVSGGENVFPSEVEELLSTHPDIDEVAAVGVADDVMGQRLRAVVVLRPGATLHTADVQAYVRAHLARFKVPRDVMFVDRLPRTPSGKVRTPDLLDL
jgi:fatty-acyl-CoA synthase